MHGFVGSQYKLFWFSGPYGFRPLFQRYSLFKSYIYNIDDNLDDGLDDAFEEDKVGVDKGMDEIELYF